MRFPPGRTYRFYTPPPVYPFGFGLSYTQFSAYPSYAEDSYDNMTTGPFASLVYRCVCVVYVCVCVCVHICVCVHACFVCVCVICLLKHYNI